jgi:acyl-CoA synthetase (AMP-forming)/AMP-acid ligase II
MAATDLDRSYDSVMAAVTGPGGRVVLAKDKQGQTIVSNFPATLPLFFKTFCALNGPVEAVVAGDERLTYAQLDEISDRVALGLVARGIGKGDRVGIAMRNCPAWILSYMAVVKAGAVATLLNGWWQPEELEHALELVDTKLVVADAPRAERIAATCASCTIETIAIEQPAEQAFADLIAGGSDGIVLPEVAPEDDATILFTSGSTGEA